ncbi:dethiobiotin synthase [Methylobacillus flagellatus]|uniref:ATP-dependent dethiobiotin synthetase BioD n=1 Tax=Methylobacillus flagellatus (strain ATCC 51484 / DSM 6875 / VKM B-1610 / KT) TaxID=265072 RepID=Q1GZB0_METFK|nr:dethiobiotin synthase [Methylobacillus flagellatus]ABE50427.1 dethiobiotin synthase [Methylobacillus flagellatus KT]
MSSNRQQAWFVTGTDTGVGKTMVSSMLVRQFSARGLRSVGMKPVASGCERRDGRLISEDVTQLLAASNVDLPLSDINPYAFEPAIAPHIAAKQAGVRIDLEPIAAAFRRLQAQANVVIVEGAGGFYVPLDEQHDMADLAAKLGLPVILVVGMRLGCINHALLTAEAIRQRGLTLAGWVANQVDPGMAMLEDNLQTLKQRMPSIYLGFIPWQDQASTAEDTDIVSVLWQ